MEIAVLTVILLVAVGGLSSAVVSSVRVSRANEETALADDAIRRVIGEMSTLEFDELFRSYNADPNDDPAGIGTGRGNTFEVVGLAPQPDDADGFVGQITFPTATVAGGAVGGGGGGGKGGMDGPGGVMTGGGGTVTAPDRVLLSEGTANPALGMPRDLNGDGVFTNLTEADYLILPVTVRIDWMGVSGRRFLQVDTVLLP